MTLDVDIRQERRKTLQLMDLPAPALAAVVACLSLPELVQLELCGSKALRLMSEASWQWEAAVAAINRINRPAELRTAFGTEVDAVATYLNTHQKAMSAVRVLRARDPRTAAAGFGALTHRRQLPQLLPYTAACVANLQACASHFDSAASIHSQLLSALQFLYAAIAAGTHGLESNDERMRRMMRVLVLRGAAEELAQGLQYFAHVFAASHPPCPFEWTLLHVSVPCTYLSHWASPEARAARDEEDGRVGTASDKHFELLLTSEPGGVSAALFGTRLAERLDPLSVARRFYCSGAGRAAW
eukprot:TRINITY_DN4078_c0_g1_i1.p1 TRINITY_DN4078_c0_g1~~TRINITY_DN4078_c0_g1_i1.p1  ORF type:complete len:300 (+),score=71.64 TRINITY_DN4078_c0_g1_i1:110-1009(+)